MTGFACAACGRRVPATVGRGVFLAVDHKSDGQKCEGSGQPARVERVSSGKLHMDPGELERPHNRADQSGRVTRKG